jgi:integrase
MPKVTCQICGAEIDKSKKFRINVSTPEGKRITRVVEGNLTFVRSVEAKIKTDVAKKDHLNLHEAPCLEDAFNLYLIWAKENKKDWLHDKGRWKLHVNPTFKNKKMDQVTSLDITNLILKMKKYKVKFTKNGRVVELLPGGPAPATKKQVLVLIKRVYNWAIKRGIYHGQNPATGIKPPKVNNQVTECLTSDELKRLMAVLDSWPNRLAALVVSFALFTGMRQDEVLSLEWKNVDLENKFVTLVDPKGTPVTLPIGGEAVKILSEALKHQPVESCPYVFPNNKGGRRVSFGKIWYRIKAKANLRKEFRFHDLRHTYASYLASSGEVDIYTLQKLLNHQDPKMTQRYAHLLDKALRRGANVADKVFGGDLSAD